MAEAFEWRERLMAAVARVAHMWGSSHDAVWQSALATARESMAAEWDSAGYVARIQLLLAVVESNEQDVLRGPRDCGEEGDSQLEQSYGGRARGKAPAQERPGTSSC